MSKKTIKKRLLVRQSKRKLQKTLRKHVSKKKNKSKERFRKTKNFAFRNEELRMILQQLKRILKDLKKQERL